jgi:hypothetical protein
MELLPCLYKSLFDFDCPICGFQRSFLLLFNGKFVESFKMYAPLLPSLLLIVLFVINLFSNRFVKRKFLFLYSSIVLVIISINYIVKLTT